MTEPPRQGGCRAIAANKWMMLIMYDLGAGPRRFTELRRGIDGISQRVLTAALRGMERDGLLTRTVHHVMPPHVSYELTPLGRGMLDAAQPLLAWSSGELPRIEAARADYDARAQ